MLLIVLQLVCIHVSIAFRQDQCHRAHSCGLLLHAGDDVRTNGLHSTKRGKIYSCRILAAQPAAMKMACNSSRVGPRAANLPWERERGPAADGVRVVAGRGDQAPPTH